MPYPMTHLVIASRLIGDIGIRDVPAFYLGSIAPDAYRNLKSEKSLEDRAAAHLMNGDEPHSCWMERVASYFSGLREYPDADFRFGYVLHLLVDMYWDGAVLSPIFKAAAGEELPYRVYAHDMGILDVELYAVTEAEASIFPKLVTAAPMGLDALISPEQAAIERDITLSWYARHLSMRAEPLLGIFSLDTLLAHADKAASWALPKITDMFRS